VSEGASHLGVGFAGGDADLYVLVLTDLPATP
jgi:hypothetical protein